jgi:hypothetical protein
MMMTNYVQNVLVDFISQLQSNRKICNLPFELVALDICNFLKEFSLNFVVWNEYKVDQITFHF